MREDHFSSWEWCVVRFVWRVKKGGKWYSRGKSKGGGGWEGRFVVVGVGVGVEDMVRWMEESRFRGE